MAYEDSREVSARGEQPQQDPSRRGMLLEQREERTARTNRGDKLGQVHQPEVGIGPPADLVDQHRAQAPEQLATARAGRSMRGSAREPPESALAFLGTGDVQLAQIATR